jgi:isovaleryl-CoA dehydrogenase
MLNFPALDFHHGETIDMLRATVQEFAADEIAPRAAAIVTPISFRPICGGRWGTWGSSALR